MRRVDEIGSILDSQNYSLGNVICDTMKRFKIRTLCHLSGFKKSSGFCVTELITLLIMLPLMALNSIHHLYKSAYAKKAAMQKDALYRLKNNEHYSWRRLLYAVAKTFKKLVNPENKPSDKTTAFILDDTPDVRVGYKMENISYMFDHVVKKTVLGFKILLLSFFDGKSNTPIDFTVHGERKLERKKAKKQYVKKVDEKSPGGKRRKEVKMSKIKAAVQLLKRAVKNGFIADYVLCDSWFACEEMMAAVRGIKGGAMHLIAGVKNGNQKYGYEGKLFNAKEITALLKAQGSAHRNKTWKTRYYEAVVTYKSIGEVKLFICRYPGQKNWRVFVTTNTSLSFVEMMKVYGIRWSIEVLFRECKQHLKLGTCQSQDFDAQIASYTICFILYTLLAYLKRIESYETLGEIFRLAQQDVCEKNLAEKLWDLFEELLEFMIKAIASHGSMDITQFRHSEEYAFVKEIFTSSFLFKQIDSVNKCS